MPPVVKRDFIDGPDGQVHVRRAGSDRSAEGGPPPLIMLHPSPLSSRYYQRLIPLLADNRLVMALDTPGFGDSFRPKAQPGLVDYAKWLAAAVVAFGIQRYDLLGHLTGSGIAAEWAVLYPERIRRLVLAGPPLFSDEQKKTLTEGAWPPRPRPDGGHLMDMWNRIRNSHSDPAWTLDDKLDEVIEYWKGGENAIWGEQAACSHDVAGTLPKVATRTLVVHANGMAPNTRQAMELLPNAEDVHCDGPGYVFMRLTPQIMADAILPFLNRPELEAA